MHTSCTGYEQLEHIKGLFSILEKSVQVPIVYLYEPGRIMAIGIRRD
jgi:hypothetical protein